MVPPAAMRTGFPRRIARHPLARGDGLRHPFVAALPCQVYFVPLTEEGRMKIEGGCLCGKVRYSADAEPVFVGMCHCSSCQKGSGSAFNIVVALPKPAVSVQGLLATFEGRGDSGK